MTDNQNGGGVEFEVRASRKKLAEDIRAAQRDLKGFGDQAEKDLSEGASSMGAKIAAFAGAGVRAITGLVSILTTAGTAALALGLAGMRMADDIATTARRIGIGTNALQEWQHVATQTGAKAKDADEALTSFSSKLAQAAAGTSKDAVKAFGMLNLGRAELRGFKSVEAAIDEVTDRIKALQSEADRLAVIEALGLGPLSNALKDTSVDVSRLRDEARQLGVVMDAEIVKRASDAQGQLETLSTVVGVQLRSAFVDLAPPLIRAIELIANLARSLSDALDQWRDLETKTSRGIRQQDSLQASEQKALLDRFGNPQNLRGRVVRARPVEGANYTDLNAMQGARVLVAGAPNLPSASRDPSLNAWQNLGRNSTKLLNTPQYVDAYEHFQALNYARSRNAIELASRVVDRPPPRDDRIGGGNLSLPPPTPPRTSNERQREEEREARRQERVEQEVYRARLRLLDIVDDEVLTVQQRFDVAQRQLDLERKAESDLLASRLARKELTQEEYNQLSRLATEAAAQEDRVRSAILMRDLGDERLAHERLLTGLTTDLLSLQGGAAKTARERLAIERQLLAAAQKRAREDLERDSDFRTLSPQRQAEVRAEQDRVFKQQEEAVRRRNLGPLDEWRERSLQSAGQVREAYEAIAARGLDTLNDALVDAIMGTEDLGETFSRVARQIIADLAAIAVRRGIVEPLANMLFPSAAGSASATGGILGGLGRFLGLSSASQGAFGSVAGDTGGLLSGRLLGNLAAPLAGVTGSSAPRAAQAVHFDLRGAVMTQDLLNQMNQMSQGAAVQAGTASFNASRQAIPAEMSRQARYRLR